MVLICPDCKKECKRLYSVKPRGKNDVCSKCRNNYFTMIYTMETTKDIENKERIVRKYSARQGIIRVPISALGKKVKVVFI